MVLGSSNESTALPTSLSRIGDFLTLEQTRRLGAKSNLVGALLVLHAWVLIGGSMALFGINQGGTDAAERARCFAQLGAMPFDGFALGGLWVGEGRKLGLEMVERDCNDFPVHKPRYLMGVGHPVDVIEAVARGVDMMDCVLPTRNARRGTVFTSTGRLVVRNASYAHDQRPLDPLAADDQDGCSRGDEVRQQGHGGLRALFQGDLDAAAGVCAGQVSKRQRPGLLVGGCDQGGDPGRGLAMEGAAAGLGKPIAKAWRGERGA